jgi:antitoxin (DNA-binding transcriptional repressor) of toxin-antitoxin stability system
MLTAGIRDLKNNLSRYVRRLTPGEPLLITDHGRAVAELRAIEGSPNPAAVPREERYARLVAAGVIRPAIESGDPLADWPSTRDVKLPRGVVAALINDDRGG